jgi:hypothetical protein
MSLPEEREERGCERSFESIAKVKCLLAEEGRERLRGEREEGEMVTSSSESEVARIKVEAILVRVKRREKRVRRVRRRKERGAEPG